MRRRGNGETKSIRFAVRLSPEQQERLKRKAAEYGVSEGDYLRHIIDQEPLVKLQTIKDINNLRLELHYVSNNLNQVAHALNGQFYHFPEDADKVRKVNDKILDVVKKIMEAFEGE